MERLPEEKASNREREGVQGIQGRVQSWQEAWGSLRQQPASLILSHTTWEQSSSLTPDSTAHETPLLMRHHPPPHPPIPLPHTDKHAAKANPWVLGASGKVRYSSASESWQDFSGGILSTGWVPSHHPMATPKSKPPRSSEASCEHQTHPEAANNTARKFPGGGEGMLADPCQHHGN